MSFWSFLQTTYPSRAVIVPNNYYTFHVYATCAMSIYTSPVPFHLIGVVQAEIFRHPYPNVCNPHPPVSNRIQPPVRKCINSVTSWENLLKKLIHPCEMCTCRF